jgi:hypothetical protein
MGHVNHLRGKERGHFSPLQGKVYHAQGKERRHFYHVKCKEMGHIYHVLLKAQKLLNKHRTQSLREMMEGKEITWRGTGQIPSHIRVQNKGEGTFLSSAFGNGTFYSTEESFPQQPEPPPPPIWAPLFLIALMHTVRLCEGPFKIAWHLHRKPCPCLT